MTSELSTVSSLLERFGIVLNAFLSSNKVILRRAWLVLGWVTMSGVQLPVWENLSQYITSHLGQLSLAIPPWVGTMSSPTSQGALMPCGWGLKVGIDCEWVTGKTVWSPCYHGPYLSALAMGSSHNRALYKCPITLTFLLLLLQHHLIYQLLWLTELPHPTVVLAILSDIYASLNKKLNYCRDSARCAKRPVKVTQGHQLW